MPTLSPSALVTDQGQRVLLRLAGRFYALSHDELREALGLPKGPAGLGISIERDRLRFEFAGDEQSIEVTARQLQRRIARKSATKR